MGTESPTTTTTEQASWPALKLNERRVLGVLVEKAKTTPDAYPLSMNSLVTGSNQKSNRDPVLDLSDLDVEEALASVQKKGLAIKIIGGRVERWRHSLYEAWLADKVELAILAELLLRGPQSEGELRGRASRMEPIEDLETLRGLLRRLAERKLVVYLGPEGRRGTMVTHGFHAPDELEHLRSRHHSEAAEAPTGVSASVNRAAAAGGETATPPAAGNHALVALDKRLATMETEVAELRKNLAELHGTVADLGAQLRALKESLGS